MSYKHLFENKGDKKAAIKEQDEASPLMFEKIAQDILRIPTLDVRGRDSLDFHDLGVTTLKKALQRAYDLGAASHATPVQEQDGRGKGYITIQVTPDDLRDRADLIDLELTEEQAEEIINKNHNAIWTNVMDAVDQELDRQIKLHNLSLDESKKRPAREQDEFKTSSYSSGDKDSIKMEVGPDMVLDRAELLELGISMGVAQHIIEKLHSQIFVSAMDAAESEIDHELLRIKVDRSKTQLGS